MSKNPLFKDFYPKRWYGPVAMRKTRASHHRQQRPELVEFKETKPIVLKNRAAGLGQGQTNVACLPEMMKLFECLQKNDYHQKNCGSLVTEFQNCFANYSAANRKRKLEKIEAKPVPYEKHLNTDQLNTLLKKFPQKIDPTLFTREGFDKNVKGD